MMHYRAGEFVAMQKIKIGIMCNGYSFPRWEADSIIALLKIPEVELRCLIVPDVSESSQDNVEQPFIRRLRRDFSHLLWYRYQVIDRKIFNPESDEFIDLSHLLKDIEVLKCKVYYKGKYSQYFYDDDISRLRDMSLDFILRYGFRIIRGDILNVTKYGIFSYHHGDHLEYRGGPPGFWEIWNNDSKTGAILQRLEHKLDDGIVVYKGTFDTIKYSYCRNRSNIYMESSNWVADVARALAFGAGENIYQMSTKSTAKIYKAPTNFEMLMFSTRILSGYVEEKKYSRNKPIDVTWRIGYIKENIETFFQSPNYPPIKWIDSPSDSYFADPFAIDYKDDTYIFFEDYSFAEKKGKISCMNLSDENNVLPVLNRSFHLSYPFIFEKDNEYYMIPEQFESNRVFMYRCVEFPQTWVEHKVILENFRGIDPTILNHEGYWYLFIGKEDDHPMNIIHLFYSRSFDTEWKPHPKSPFEKRDDIRNAGNTFKYEDRLFRFSQSSNGGYGSHLILNEITQLTPTEYRERFFCDFFPDSSWSFSDGFHHLSTSSKHFLALDAKKLLYKKYFK